MGKPTSTYADLTNSLENLIDRYQNKINDQTQNIIENITLRYNDALIKNGIILSKEDIKSKNLIDIRKLMDLPKTDDPMDAIRAPILTTIPDISPEFRQDMDWLALVPCFKEAIIRSNTKRYMYYKVTNIDSENKTMSAYVQEYIWFKGEYTTGVFADITWDFSKVNSYNSRASFLSVANEHTLPDIYKMIPYDELGWNSQQIDLWESVVLDHAMRTEQEITSKHQNTFQNLAGIFNAYILLTNYQLYLHKPSRPVQSGTKPHTKTQIGDVTAKDKIIRHVGIISIKSTRPPKLPTDKSIVQYTTPIWTAKGHVRTYKSGKKVFVKESIRHRKALEKQMPDNAPQQILKFVDTKHKHDETASKGENDE